MKPIIKRYFWTVLLSIPILIALNLLVSVVFCFGFGPWGAELETVSEEDIPWYVPFLNLALWLAQIVLAVLLAWRISGKLDRKKLSNPSRRSGMLA
ncbi:hypothetical protein [Algisphaera agarilytica]|uniref:Membrane protein implicated in regulation of membrane protease activity n=1 Tax=Algisphaera agarilytica TaxID=1385975 RepID=A0A7X0H862_9BACT|nr:hypothetical protein [Algisphaera agarilytica]MBB6430888.1 membrane protein implicated in regulation of membrane protease activity [Algisphaera agarilytica]